MTEIEELRAENDRLANLVLLAEEDSKFVMRRVPEWMSLLECEWCSKKAHRIIDLGKDGGSGEVQSYRVICNDDHGCEEHYPRWIFEAFDDYQRTAS